MSTLSVLQGPDKGRAYQVADEAAVIGRSSEQIQLSDDSASRRHAEIRPVNGFWVLEDLDSSNGTFLNGQRVVTPTVLRHGDQIRVGATLLVFGGPEQMQGMSGPQTIPDLVDLDLNVSSGGSSILAAVDAGADSVILQPPDTNDAVAAWNVVYKIVETVGTAKSVPEFLERVADIVYEQLVVDCLVLLTYSPDSEELVPQIVRCRTQDPDERPKVTTSRTIINHVVGTREGVLCANAMTDNRFVGESKQDSIHRLGLRSIICVPIVAHDEVHGVFHLDCSMSRHTYSQEQLRLAVAIGQLTGLALENAKFVESRVYTERLAATGETVAYLSHHIRNILQGMQGGADVIELAFRKNDVEAAKSGWRLVRRNLDRILQLTMNMLTFSKQRQPRAVPTQLNKIVEDVLSLVQNGADDNSVMVLSELEEIPPTLVDPDGMHQVVHNIVLNAIDAAPAHDGRVIVRTSYDPTSDRVVLSITDNGSGISPDAGDTIFDAFHSSKGQRGTGLGLAAAKKIIEESNGSIEVESAPGQGATFRVSIPVQSIQSA